MHILIIEDDETARTYLAKALREAGHTVDVAPNGVGSPKVRAVLITEREEDVISTVDARDLANPGAVRSARLTTKPIFVTGTTVPVRSPARPGRSVRRAEAHRHHSFAAQRAGLKTTAPLPVRC